MTIWNSDVFAGGGTREPAVAGTFYIANPDSLRREVERYISGGPALPVAPKLIISPHAGYVFSGPVAGKGFATIDRATKTVILLGPSHHVWLEGVAVPGNEWFRTPLGNVAVDRERIKKLLANPIVSVSDEAHAPEHCLEVQIPFLQVRLQSFTIVPVLIGNVSPQAVADLVFPLIDASTTVIASSDLSHYHPQRDARKIDDRSIAAILAGDAGGSIDACGELPIRVAMLLAKKMGLAPSLLDARTSYETAPRHSPDNRVVGYSSIAYCPAQNNPAPAAVKPPREKEAAAPRGIPADVKRFLLTLARTSLDASVKKSPLPEPKDIPDITKENRGCFVTLTIRGELRGCIGYIEPIKPLYRAVIENARNAALSDPRFAPVAASELGSITVEVSVLTKPAPLDYKDPQDLLRKLVPHVDGVILQSGPHQSTYLPQVWEQLPEKVDFLEHLSLKGGMARDGWKTAHVKRYQAEHFSE